MLDLHLAFLLGVHADVVLGQTCGEVLFDLDKGRGGAQEAFAHDAVMRLEIMGQQSA